MGGRLERTKNIRALPSVEIMNANPGKPIPFALIIPCHNFVAGLPETLRRLAAWMPNTPSGTQVYFVDDGSTDATAKLLADFVSHQPSGYTLLKHKNNRGKGAALLTGLQACQDHFEAVVFTDCDLHYGLTVILDRILPALQNYDVVLLDRSWVRKHHWMSPWRRLSSSVFNRLVSILTGVNYRDTQAGLKGFRTTPLKHLWPLLRLQGFAFDIELLSLACFYRLPILQIPIAFDLAYQAPTHSTIHRFLSPITMVRDLFRINWYWKRGYYYSAPLVARIDATVYSVHVADEKENV